MAGTPLRYLEKFESDGASVSYTFPLNAYEWQSTQPLRTAYGRVVGANYPHDHYGSLQAPKGRGIESYRAMIVKTSAAAVDTELDNMKEELVNIGRGKLYTLTAAGVRRWATARLAGMPEFSVNPTHINHQPVIVRFDRLSDWKDSSETTGSELNITTSPKAFTINNPGNAPVYDAVFTIDADTAGGFSNLAITNSTTGYSITTTRDSAADTDQIVIDCGKGTYEFNGADDFSLVTLGTTQTGFMKLDPGNNSFSVTCDGTPSYDFAWAFYGNNH